MMKQLFTTLSLVLLLQHVQAQITITNADMPVAGDTARYSIVDGQSATLNLSTTGPNTAWNYSSLAWIDQEVDTFKTATQAGYTISGNPTGFKIADTLDLSGSGSPLPVTITNAFMFFKNSTASYNVSQIAAKTDLFGTIVINYTDQDEMYFFPLTYNRYDTSTYKASYSNLLVSIYIKGKRKTKVDGWGTLVTPHYTTPQNVLRVRSESIETDSIVITGQQPLSIDRDEVDYKWLANGVHTPLLWITTDVSTTPEQPLSVLYLDHKRFATSGVKNISANTAELNAYPNPVVDGMLHVAIPANWKNYSVEIYDAQGKLATKAYNTSVVNIQSLASGSYIVRLGSGNEVGFLRITK